MDDDSRTQKSNDYPASLSACVRMHLRYWFVCRFVCVGCTHHLIGNLTLVDNKWTMDINHRATNHYCALKRINVCIKHGGIDREETN